MKKQYIILIVLLSVMSGTSASYASAAKMVSPRSLLISDQHVALQCKYQYESCKKKEDCCTDKSTCEKVGNYSGLVCVDPP